MTNRRLLGGVIGLLALAASACAASTDPADRAVSLTTTACGHASATSGAGVIAENGWVVASAHVVSGAGSIEVSGPFGTEAAEIVVFDADADLALLRVPSAGATPVIVAAASAGDAVHFGGGGPSGRFDASIVRPVEVRIEAVRSTVRTSRTGYEIDARVALGDSGGGVFDDAGRLVGVVFGRPLGDADRTFVVGYEEINALLAAERDGSWGCDELDHRVVPTAG